MNELISKQDLSHQDKAIATEGLKTLFRHIQNQPSSHLESTIILLPPAAHRQNPSINPYGTYSMPSINQPRHLSEEPLTAHSPAVVSQPLPLHPLIAPSPPKVSYPSVNLA